MRQEQGGKRKKQHSRDGLQSTTPTEDLETH